MARGVAPGAAVGDAWSWVSVGEGVAPPGIMDHVTDQSGRPDRHPSDVGLDAGVPGSGQDDPFGLCGGS